MAENEKIEKQNQFKTCKEEKRLFKVDIKTKVYVTKNI